MQNLLKFPVPAPSVAVPAPAAAGVAPSTGPRIVELPVEKIVPNPAQPRDRFGEAEMASLADSIRAVGVVQPVIVRPLPNGTYELVAGERRWRASIEADRRTIPAIVREISSTESLEIALIENIQRSALTPIETALAYKSLLEEHGLTHEEVAHRVGKDRTTITNTLRLLKLPLEIQEMVNAGQITEGHARALLSLEDKAEQIAIAIEVVKKGLSVRDVEARIAGRPVQPEKAPKRQGHRKPEWRAAEEQMIRKWGREVRIRGNKNGRIELYYHGIEDLNRLVRSLLG